MSILSWMINQQREGGIETGRGSEEENEGGWRVVLSEGRPGKTTRPGKQRQEVHRDLQCLFKIEVLYILERVTLSIIYNLWRTHSRVSVFWRVIGGIRM